MLFYYEQFPKIIRNLSDKIKRDNLEEKTTLVVLT